MKREAGFSLIEILVAAGLLLMLALAAQQLISSTTKGAGNLERRLRYRDLVEDIRFQFSNSRLCSEYIRNVPLSEGAPARVALGPQLEVADGVVLHDYGLKVNRLVMRNVRQHLGGRRTLLKPGGELAGEYTESVTVGELYIEAEMKGGGTPLRPLSVVRIARVERRGAIQEDFCYGSREGGSSGPSGGPSEGEWADGGFDAPSSGAVQGRPAMGGGASPRGPAQAAEPSAPLGNCPIEDASERVAAGRARLFEGETLRFLQSGRGISLRCRGGVLERF